jgi:hypothetical protein
MRRAISRRAAARPRFRELVGVLMDPLGQCFLRCASVQKGKKRMTRSLDENYDPFRPMAPLLSADSADNFASLRKELKREIQPNGVIEQMYIEDIASLIFEIMRLRRYKAVIVNNSRLEALRGILEQLLCHPNTDLPYDDDLVPDDLARSWFDNKTAQTKVANLLRKYQMSEDAIEAQAFRWCAEDLERLDRILMALEFRRDKALRSIADYRRMFSKQLEQAANRILDNHEGANDELTEDGERTANRREPAQRAQQQRPSLHFWEKTGEPKCFPAWPDEAHLKRRVRS